MMSKKNSLVWVVLIVSVLSLFPFIGLNEFHTKGEPREAVVSLSMLLQDNFILPQNNGGDIPYKPPFLHWCIAFISLFFGTLNEYIARIPSAISLVVVSAATFLFYRNKAGVWNALLTAMICITCFELHRAGGNCRVDMLLSAAMILASYLLFRWWKNDALHGFPVLALIAMSIATLTKGPIGVCLPLFVFAVFLLLRKENFWKIVLKLLPLFVLSLVAPLLWYYAAFKQGGQHFLDLVYEENIGRLTGTMTYASHEGPAIINFVYLLGGFVPYTFLLVFSLFFKVWKYRDASESEEVSGWKNKLKAWWKKILDMPDYRLYTLLCAVLIIFFFCIPKSKRSVYLMPAFPFIAFFIAEYILWLEQKVRRANNFYRGFLFAVICILFVAHILFKLNLFAATKPDVQAVFDALASLSLLKIVSTFAIVFALLWYLLKKVKDNRITLPALGFILFALLDFLTLPTILNTKSVKAFAAEINRVVPEGEIYSFLKSDIRPNANMIHFFELDYYLDDRIKIFLKDKPESGKLIVQEKQFAEFRDTIFGDYEMKEILRSDRPYGTFKDIILLLQFEKRR